MCAETNVYVEECLDDAEEPVCHASLGSEHYAEHTEDGCHGCYTRIDTEIVLDDERHHCEREDGEEEQRLEPVEVGETLLDSIYVFTHWIGV